MKTKNIISLSLGSFYFIFTLLVIAMPLNAAPEFDSLLSDEGNTQLDLSSNEKKGISQGQKILFYLDMISQVSNRTNLQSDEKLLQAAMLLKEFLRTENTLTSSNILDLLVAHVTVNRRKQDQEKELRHIELLTKIIEVLPELPLKLKDAHFLFEYSVNMLADILNETATGTNSINALAHKKRVVKLLGKTISSILLAYDIDAESLSILAPIVTGEKRKLITVMTDIPNTLFFLEQISGEYKERQHELRITTLKTKSELSEKESESALRSLLNNQDITKKLTNRMFIEMVQHNAFQRLKEIKAVGKIIY